MAKAPPRPLHGRRMRFRQYMIDVMGYLPEQLTRGEVKAQWAAKVRDQADKPRRRFLYPATKAGSSRRIDPVAYRMSYPDEVHDPMIEARENAAEAAARIEVVEDILARLRQLERERDSASRRIAKVSRTCDSRQRISDERMGNLKRLFSETFRAITGDEVDAEG